MVVGGIWSLIELAKPLIDGIRSSFTAYSHLEIGINIPREEQDFPIKYVLIALLALLIPVFHNSYLLQKRKIFSKYQN